MYVIVYLASGERDWQVYTQIQGVGENREPLIMWGNEGNALAEARDLSKKYPSAKWGVSGVLSPKIIGRDVYPLVHG